MTYPPFSDFCPQIQTSVPRPYAYALPLILSQAKASTSFSQGRSHCSCQASNGRSPFGCLRFPVGSTDSLRTAAGPMQAIVASICTIALSYALVTTISSVCVGSYLPIVKTLLYCTTSADERIWASSTTRCLTILNNGELSCILRRSPGVDTTIS